MFVVKNKELTKRILFTLGIVIVFELGKHIILPMLDVQSARRVLKGYTFLQVFAATTGGQASTPTLFSVGLAPYMTGMILLQALKMLDFNFLKNMTPYQEGFLQRFVMLALATIQAIQLAFLLKSEFRRGPIVFGIDINILGAVIVLVAGAMWISWLADVNSEHGVGGLGILIIPSLISSTPQLLGQGEGLGTMPLILTKVTTAILIVVVLILIFLTVWINKAEERIPVKRPMVQNDYEESYLPIRVLTAGAMPLMFSTSVFMIPRYITAYGVNNHAIQFVNDYLSFDNWVGVLIYTIIVLGLSYAFGYMNFQPEELAKSLKKSGDYLENVVPGEETQKFLSRKMILVSTTGNLYLTFVCAAPLVVGLFVDGISNLSFVFSNLFILVTIMDNVFDQANALRYRDDYDLLKFEG